MTSHFALPGRVVEPHFTGEQHEACRACVLLLSLPGSQRGAGRGVVEPSHSLQHCPACHPKCLLFLHCLQPKQAALGVGRKGPPQRGPTNTADAACRVAGIPQCASHKRDDIRTPFIHRHVLPHSPSQEGTGIRSFKVEISTHF
jgi:hypothetical protein